MHQLPVERTAKIKLRGKRKTLYKMIRDEDGGNWIKPEEDKGTVASVEAARDLHERYGHISYDTLRTLPNFPKIPKAQNPRYEPCQKGKATKPPARTDQKRGKNSIRTSQPLERLHADLVVPINPMTPGKQYRYLLVIVDDYSRYMVVKALQKKSQTREVLMSIITSLETACNYGKVKAVQADWGGEFRNKELEEELRQRDTLMKETVPHHSETNPVVERVNSTIFTMNKTFIAQSGLPKGMWDKTSLWSAYVENRLPHRTLGGDSPIRKMFIESNLEEQRRNLWKFGEKVIYFDYQVTDKLSARSYEGRIIGYTHTYGVYQILDKRGAIKLAKNPRPIQEDEEDEVIEEPIIDQPAKAPEEPPSLEAENTRAQSPTVPPPAPRKTRRKKDWSELVGTREPSARVRQPTWKARTGAVGTDPDHPTDAQVRNSPQAEEWAKAGTREREQLARY